MIYVVVRNNDPENISRKKREKAKTTNKWRRTSVPMSQIPPCILGEHSIWHRRKISKTGRDSEVWMRRREAAKAVPNKKG